MYRTVDKFGNTIDFYLSKTRNKSAAKTFLSKSLNAKQNSSPYVITVDKNPAYPIAIDELKDESRLSSDTAIRQVKYLNNIVEQPPQG